jgi:hypothetical protein
MNHKTYKAGIDIKQNEDVIIFGDRIYPVIKQGKQLLLRMNKKDLKPLKND